MVINIFCLLNEHTLHDSCSKHFSVFRYVYFNPEPKIWSCCYLFIYLFDDTETLKMNEDMNFYVKTLVHLQNLAAVTMCNAFYHIPIFN